MISIRLTHTSLFLVSLLWCSCVAEGQSITDQQAARELQQAQDKSLTAYKEKQYAVAAQILADIFTKPESRMVRDWQQVMYNLACSQAMAGQKHAAIDSLTAAEADGNTETPEEVLRDTDLLSLHSDPSFMQIIGEMKLRMRLWGTEPGATHPFVQNLSEDDKVAGLSTIWSEARYNFAFFARQPNLDWNQLYLDTLPKVRATTSTADYYRVLIHFVAELKDGHSNVYPPVELMDTFYARPGISTALIEGKVVVTGLPDAALAATGWRVGDIITRVNGRDVREYAEEEVAPYQSSSTPQDADVRAYSYSLLRGNVHQPLALTVEDEEGRSSVRTVTRLSSEQTKQLRHPESAAFRMLQGEIAYVAVDEFEDDGGPKAVLAHLAQINAAKGLILDVRRNGGGSSEYGYNILQMLADKPFLDSLQRTPQYTAVDRAHGGTPGWQRIEPEAWKPDAQHHIAVPVVVLTSAQTFSAAEDFVVSFDAMHRGTIVGEPTGGSTGQPFFFHLPGGGTARICTKDDRYPDGKIFEGVGVIPQVRVSPTIEDVRRGRDEAVSAALRVLLQAGTPQKQ